MASLFVSNDGVDCLIFCLREGSPKDGDVAALDVPLRAGVVGAKGLLTDGGALRSAWVCVVAMGPKEGTVDFESSSSPFLDVVGEIEVDFGMTTKELGVESL